MKIPDCREALDAVADRLVHANTYAERARLANQIRFIISEMYRRPAVRKAPRKARHVTPALSRRLREDALANPDICQRDIGRRHGVDGGRVSEAVAGKRV